MHLSRRDSRTLVVIGVGLIALFGLGHRLSGSASLVVLIPLAAVVVTKPEGSHVTWEVIEIDKKVPRAAWATELLVAYNRSLCAITMVSTGELPCASAADSKNNYVGTSKCGTCHPAQLVHHQKTYY